MELALPMCMCGQVALCKAAVAGPSLTLIKQDVFIGEGQVLVLMKEGGLECMWCVCMLGCG